MELDVQREAAIGQPLDQVRFPQGSRAVHQRAMQAGHQHQQLADAPGPRQCEVAQVIIDIEVGVRLPVPLAHAQHRALVEGFPGLHMLAPALEDLLHMVFPGARRRRVDMQRGNVHGLLPPLEHHEHGVLQAHRFHRIPPGMLRNAA